MATSGRTAAGQPYRFKVGRAASRGWHSCNSRREVVSPTRIQNSRQDRNSSSSSCTGRAPRHIRQSRSCHRREQSFAHSGVRHALLPPAGDGALLHVGRSSSSSSFLRHEELRAITIHAAGDKWADRGGSALPPTTDHRPRRPSRTVSKLVRAEDRSCGHRHLRTSGGRRDSPSRSRPASGSFQ